MYFNLSQAFLALGKSKNAMDYLDMASQFQKVTNRFKISLEHFKRAKRSVTETSAGEVPARWQNESLSSDEHIRISRSTIGQW